MKGIIFDIKRFAVHDGDGIRTTVFFKGCPLSCIWCHNPEGISREMEVQYIKSKCQNCGRCITVCENKAHCFENGVHIYDRNKCLHCGKCIDACLNTALRCCGREMTVDEVLEVVLKDKDFYIQSGGGVTLSGGECLCQADFCVELLKRLKEHGINCNVDTSGFVESAVIEKVAPYTDVFLYDIKHTDVEKHCEYTGVRNQKIIENLMYIDSLNKKIEVRIPVIPGVNDDKENIIQTAKLLSKIKNLCGIRLLPYNNLAGSKYENLGRNNTMPKVLPPTKKQIDEVKKIFNDYRLQVMG